MFVVVLCLKYNKPLSTKALNAYGFHRFLRMLYNIVIKARDGIFRTVGVLSC